MIAWTDAPTAPVPLDLADRIAEAVLACPDVTELTAGPRGRIATHRVTGVTVRDGEIEVGVVVRYGRPFPEIAEDVRRLIRPLTGDRMVHILIADLADR